MKKKFIVFISFFLLATVSAKAQDLMGMLGSDSAETKDYTTATFKTIHLILGQSIETTAKGNMNFTISHHFGKLKDGASSWFGLDQSTIRFGFDYGVTDWLSAGLGGSTYKKTFDGNIKAKLLRQKKKGMPITLDYYGELTVNALPWADPNRVNYFTSRLGFINQLLIASKISDKLSVQLSPTHVHKNLVSLIADQNDIFALGGGIRYKITQRMSVNAEYYYLMPGQTAKDYFNSLSIGIDIETGGHVFQFFLTNSHPLFTSGFVTETNGTWTKGDIFLGFNIHRIFTIIN